MALRRLVDLISQDAPAVKARTAQRAKSSDRRREEATVSCMFKKLLIIAVIVGVGFLAAKKMRAA